MCRLCAVTQTSNPSVTVDLIDRMLLLSQADGDHIDGCGLSNGNIICKSAARFSDAVFGFYNNTELFPTDDKIILGHVRKASSLTGKTREESHPYHFTIKGNRTLHCAHNGWITGTGGHQKDTPDTDSWRAFNQLSALLEKSETGDITVPIMQEWLKEYNESSQLGLMMLYDGVLHVFRHNKPIHAMGMGNGYVLNTSKEVLARMGGWLKNRHGIETGDVIELPEEYLITFKPGSEKFWGERVYVEYRTYKYTYTNSYNNDYAQTSTTVYPLVSPKSSSETPAKAGAAPATPTPATGESKEVIITTPYIVEERSRFRRIIPIAQEIRKVANPMRFNIYAHWLRHSMGIEADDTYESEIERISMEDLALFQKMNGDWSSRQADLIHVWNRLVDKGTDARMHDAIFGTRWFWLDPWFINPDISREVALNRLRKEISGLE